MRRKTYKFASLGIIDDFPPPTTSNVAPTNVRVKATAVLLKYDSLKKIKPPTKATTGAQLFTAATKDTG